jgi:PhnB protein
MAIKKLNPYVAFAGGRAEEAIKLYERALGAKTEQVLRYGDVPQQECAASDKKLVMHACLRIGDERLMVNDLPPGHPAPRDSNMSVVIDVDDLTELAHKFEALSAGGKVEVPLHDTFWGGKFGILSDAFGVRWMFNSEQKRA